jgi:CheY-like chemotaxis protein
LQLTNGSPSHPPTANLAIEFASAIHIIVLSESLLAGPKESVTFASIGKKDGVVKSCALDPPAYRSNMAPAVESDRQARTCVRVLLADDSPSMLQAARLILEPEFHIVGTVDDGQAVFEAAESLKPDVVILDISMGLMSGLEAARLLSRVGSKAKIVFLTVHKDREFVEEAFSAGAVGYVVKPRLCTDLLLAVREALMGHTFVSPDLISRS